MHYGKATPWLRTRRKSNLWFDGGAMRLEPLSLPEKINQSEPQAPLELEQCHLGKAIQAYILACYFDQDHK